MGTVAFPIDRYADTLEIPALGKPLHAVPAWERAQIDKHLGEHFQVVREIGRGGMGIVFLARDIALHRLVAIKVLRYEFTSSEAQRERFRSEARMTARLHHPNIVPVHTFGEVHDDDDESFLYIVMKYVHGESLAQRMRRERTLPVSEVRRILRDLALALESAHRDGVIHRDLKAENIVLDRANGQAVLTDFGVALLRSLDPVRGEAAHAFGTPHYMSPEQAAGELNVDERSDLYSIGILGYYMLTGKLPFDGQSFEALAARHITEPPRSLAELRADVPASLRDAIERCLMKDRKRRWRTSREFIDALDKRPSKRSWFGTSVVLRSRVLAHAALLGTALKALSRWV